MLREVGIDLSADEKPVRPCRLVIIKNRKVRGMKWILITGRTRKQGIGLVKGKLGADYRQEVEQVELAHDDMVLLGLNVGEQVLVESDFGSMTGVVRKNDGLPKGMVFIPQGPLSNKLIGYNTGGTGMPDFKGLPVEIKPA